jgi:hypothetical protein
MFDNEEKQLMELSKRLNNTPKPDCIDDYIKRGIKLAQVKKKKIKIRIFANVAVLVIFIILSASIRVSPVFASYISKVPGLQYLVDLVHFDKGISDAVENKFIQNINMSQEHEGLVFTIKDIIIDNSKAILFYSIQNKTNHKFVNIAEIKLKDENGKEVIAVSGFDLFVNKNMMDQKELLGKIEFNFSNEETIIPDRLFIDVKLQDEATNESISQDKRNILISTWNFNIPIDKEKLENMKVVYNLNQNIEIHGQKIFFKTVTITPTQISAEIEYDKSNSKKILGYDDIEIVNESGEKWATIMNGVSGTRKDDDHQTLFFQSNYFTSPKELYIKGSSIKSLDKDKLKVIVDVDKKVLLKAPDGKLTLKSVTALKGETSLEFELLKDKILDKDKGYFVFLSDFEDSDGNIINQKASGGTHLNGTDRQYIDYTITTDSKFKNPISLTIWDYPTRIKGDFKVKIK